MSPVDCVGLPYFENYMKLNDGKQLLCISLCDNVRFQGYIIEINHNKIIHIDSLSRNNSNNGMPKKIAVSSKVEQMFDVSPYLQQEYSSILTAAVFG